MKQPVIRRAGVEDALGIARVHVDSWRTTYAGTIPEDFLAGLSHGTSKEQWQSRIRSGKPENFHVAEVPSEVLDLVAYLDEELVVGDERAAAEKFREILDVCCVD